MGVVLKPRIRNRGATAVSLKTQPVSQIVRLASSVSASPRRLINDSPVSSVHTMYEFLDIEQENSANGTLMGQIVWLCSYGQPFTDSPDVGLNRFKRFKYS